MVLIPTNGMNTTANAIDSKMFQDELRPYLGMSGIGHSCDLAIWFGFRWATKSQHEARVERIFRRGDLEEARIIADLKSVGVEVYRPGSNGEHIELFGTEDEEQEELVGFAGHAKGHTDGRCLGIIEAPKTPHLLEMKTANSKNFKKYIGTTLKVANPVYYGQVQRYMESAKLTRTMFIVTNKDDESRHSERVYFDKDLAADLVRKESDIILSMEPPEKRFAKSWYECRYCNHKKVCHYEGIPAKSCRTCEHIELCNAGVWKCDRTSAILSYGEQLTGCDKYSRLF